MASRFLFDRVLRIILGMRRSRPAGLGTDISELNSGSVNGTASMVRCERTGVQVIMVGTSASWAGRATGVRGSMVVRVVPWRSERRATAR